MDSSSTDSSDKETLRFHGNHFPSIKHTLIEFLLVGQKKKQKKVSDSVKHITIETIQQLYQSTTSSRNLMKSVGVADLGCSSGPNTLSIIKEIINAIDRESRKKLKPAKEIRVYLNDLPSNDFNSIFMELPEFYKELERDRSGDDGRECSSVFIAGYPGSCYGRLFPNECLHFVYSSYCLHWLSRIPPAIYNEQGKSINKGFMYISPSSPPEVSQAYLKQFQENFSLFLRARSEELVGQGRMMLILLGRSGADHFDRGNSFFWELLSRSFSALVSRGEVEEEKVDSYDVHFYAPNKDEIEKELKKEGSFEMERFEMLEIEKDEEKGVSYGTRVSMTVRAIQESMISYHFGESILDNLFDTYGRIIDEEIAADDLKPITFVLVLKKIVSLE